MILADKITNERKKNGWSQEDLAEKLSVSRQSVSKWESAQAVPDLQKILKMAEIFGVSTDYLLKDELEPEINLDNSYFKSDDTNSSPLRSISLQEANEFLKIQEKNAPVTALGVSLCIISPAVLIFLTGFEDLNERFGVIGSAIGLVVLLVLVAIAVFLFMTSSAKLKKFEFLEKEIFETAYGVTGMVKEKQNENAETHTRHLSLGIILCILSVIPLVSLSILFEDKDYIATACVSLLLCIASVGVNLIVRTSIIEGSYKKLLQENDYSVKAKKENAFLSPLSSIYWLIITAAYLAASFITNRWEITWIIWPVSAVIYPVFIQILKLIHKKNG